MSVLKLTLVRTNEYIDALDPCKKGKRETARGKEKEGERKEEKGRNIYRDR